MIPLKIAKKNNFISMTYKSEADYFKIHDEIEDNYYKYTGVITSPNDRNSFYHTEVTKPAHRIFWNSLDYSLRELLNHFKAIEKVYGEYLIVDYYFNGIFLTDDDLHMHHCWFGADDEEFEDSGFNLHLLGEPLTKFIEDLTHQKEMGDINIKEIRAILMYNKPTKPKRKRTRVPKGMRHEVFKRDNYTCCECGARKSDGATLHIDHIVPVSKGGSDELDNLQTLCSDCNLNKSDVIQR